MTPSDVRPPGVRSTPGAGARSLGAELADALASAPEVAPGTILLAWSGGLDSTVLLHILARDQRVQAATGGARVVAAHLDHAMRDDSRDDADAVRRIAEAWGVELRTHRLPAPPSSEEEARNRRYGWLAEVADEIGANETWTAHHADDQAETVLFRVLRGTGIAGLAGIPVRRGQIRRPFLMIPAPVRRADLLRHAEAHDLPIRPDPSNTEPIATRNRLRNEVVPLLEEIVPGSVDALLRLARNATRASDEADALVELVLRLASEAGDPGASDVSPSDAVPAAPDAVPASVWEGAERPLRRAFLRHLASRSGVALSEAATRAALDLPPDIQSGRGVDLPGGLRFEREFDRWRLFPPAGDESTPDRRERIRISLGDGARDRLTLGGRALSISWSIGKGEADAPPSASLEVDLPSSSFPLTLRRWRPGDRIARPFGTTPVAKAWSEARVPRRERERRWVLVDREGEVLAAEGLGAARRDPTIEESNTTRVTLYLRLDVEE